MQLDFVLINKLLNVNMRNQYYKQELFCKCVRQLYRERKQHKCRFVMQKLRDFRTFMNNAVVLNDNVVYLRKSNCFIEFQYNEQIKCRFSLFGKEFEREYDCFIPCLEDITNALKFF